MKYLKLTIVFQFILILILAIVVFFQSIKVKENEFAFDALSEKISTLEMEGTEVSRDDLYDEFEDLKSTVSDHDSLFMRHAEFLEEQGREIKNIRRDASTMQLSIDNLESSTNQNSDNINSQQIALESICKKLNIRFC